MKKYICLIICLTTIISLFSCTGNTTSEETIESGEYTSEPAKVTTEITTTEETTRIETEIITFENITTEEITTEEVTTEEITEIVTEDESEKYKDIKRRTPNDYERFYFGVAGDEEALCVVLPDDWKFTRASSSVYLIERGGNNIGKAVIGTSLESSSWRVIKTTTSSSGNPKLSIYLETCGSGEDLEFRHRLHYLFTVDGKQRELAITIDYAELSSAAEQKINMFSRIKAIATTDPGMGILADTKFERGILIIGNSFIGTSKIGTTLTELLNANGKKVEVTAISRAYAHVSTYTGDSYLMDRIARGEFGIVFVCGFYDYDQPTHLGLLKKACDKSGTAIVAFPAHNESKEVLRIALEENPDIVCLDWKAEINALIDQGISMWEFCIDDMHLHSTPLAGYVGAHMIYRALYGQIPRSNVYEAVTKEQIKSILGSYATSGIVYAADSDFIVMFE